MIKCHYSERFYPEREKEIVSNVHKACSYFNTDDFQRVSNTLFGRHFGSFLTDFRLLHLAEAGVSLEEVERMLGEK